MVDDVTKEVGERIAHTPSELDRVRDLEFKDGKPLLGQSSLIVMWDDGYGNIVFTKDPAYGPYTKHSQIKSLSDRIQTSKSAFGQLKPGEQSSILAEFDSSRGVSDTTQPYKDYLQNEALGKRFEELKANPPGPFGNK